MPRLLLFSYFYPPLGGPAVQRPLKMIKYLSTHNWQIDVISTDDVFYHSRDEELVREDRAEKVIRVRSEEPMALLNRIDRKRQGWGSAVYFRTPEFLKSLIRRSYFIDDKHAWLKPAVAAALNLCRENRYAAVMATLGPFTAGVAAYKVSRYWKIPLIIDYRDHWNLNPYISYLTSIHRGLARAWEKRLLRAASLITVVGEKMGEELVQSYRIPSTRLQVMYNGWDEDDFRDLQPGETNGESRVFSYIGNFYGQRTPRYFLKAILELRQEKKLPAGLKLLFVGNFYRETQHLLQDPFLSDILTIIPQTGHQQALAMMADSDVLLLFIASHRENSVLTGKLFEYLRSGKNILAMVPPQGEAARILRRLGHNYLCPMEDVAAVKDKILQIWADLESGRTGNYQIDPHYSRENQTRELAERLNQLTGHESE